MDSNENKKGIKKTRRVFILFIFIFITTVILLVGTYAWFVGITTVSIDPFTINVTTGGGIELSLDGKRWRKSGESLKITEAAVTTTTAEPDHAYEGNTNNWTSGLEPVSSSGDLDLNASRLKLFQKTSISTTSGGYKLIAGRVDNYSEGKSEADVYVTFDLFIKNGEADPYSSTYNKEADEAVYMLKNPYVIANTAGVNNYGLQNSVRMGFFSLGRVPTANSTQETITGISCASTPVLCPSTEQELSDRLSYTWNIWEPNDINHAEPLVEYFNGACKQRDNTTGEYIVDQNNLGVPCLRLTEEYPDPDETYPDPQPTPIKTYTVKGAIDSVDNVDIYDGINGKTPDPTKLVQFDTYKTSDANSDENNKKKLLSLAGNSITKVRVYIWIEGQDIDNYDLITKDTSITIAFGLTKDKFNTVSTASPSPTTSP